MSTASVSFETDRSEIAPLYSVLAVGAVLLLEGVLFRERLVAMTLQSQTVQWFVFAVSAVLLLAQARRVQLARELQPAGIALVLISCSGLLLLDALKRPWIPTTPLLLAVCTFGSMWALFGAAEAKRELFPSAYLLLMTPLPTLLTVTIDLPLQNLSAALAAGAAGVFGIATDRAGTTIGLAHSEISLRIIGDCNGLRSAIAMLAVSILLAWLLRARFWKAVALVLGAVAIAYAANIVRLASILALVSKFGDRFVSHLHTFEMWGDAVLFLASVALVFQFARVLGCRTFREI